MAVFGITVTVTDAVTGEAVTASAPFIVNNPVMVSEQPPDDR